MDNDLENLNKIINKFKESKRLLDLAKKKWKNQ